MTLSKSLNLMTLKINTHKLTIHLSLPVRFTRLTKVVIKCSDLSHKIFAPNKRIRLTSLLQLGKVRRVAHKYSNYLKISALCTFTKFKKFSNEQIICLRFRRGYFVLSFLLGSGLGSAEMDKWLFSRRKIRTKEAVQIVKLLFTRYLANGFF